MRSLISVRATLRDAITFFFILLTGPLWVPVKLIGFDGREVGLFTTFGQALSLIPGRIGAFSRRAFYIMTLEECARDVGIGFGTWFSKRRVCISPQVSFGAHCLIGSCIIGKSTLFGSNIDVLSGRHQHVADGSSNVRAGQSNSFTQVRIGTNVWVGNRAIIMADVGDNSVIGAGSVVVKSIPLGSMAAGNPAKVIKNLEFSQFHES